MMLPKDKIPDFELTRYTTLTYYLDYKNGRIMGFTDGIEAMEQAIYRILRTQRYKYLGYSWNYGNELSSLFGQAIDFMIPETKRLVTEALMQDDRITGVDDFTFEKDGEKLICNFTVHTIFGEVNANV